MGKGPRWREYTPIGWRYEGGERSGSGRERAETQADSPGDYVAHRFPLSKRLPKRPFPFTVSPLESLRFMAAVIKSNNLRFDSIDRERLSEQTARRKEEG